MSTVVGTVVVSLFVIMEKRSEEPFFFQSLCSFLFLSFCLILLKELLRLATCIDQSSDQAIKQAINSIISYINNSSFIS